MSKRAVDHEKFVGIMKSVAHAEEMQQKDNRKEINKPSIEERTCFTCDKKRSCKVFNVKTSTSGVYSIGGDVKVSSCEKWAKRRDNPSDPKQIKSLLKHFKGLMN